MDTDFSSGAMPTTNVGASTASGGGNFWKSAWDFMTWPVTKSVDIVKGMFGGGDSSDPLGDTWRGFGSDWFNQNNVAREDWMRGEMSADNAYERAMKQLEYQNQFNAEEAQKDRDFQERMRDTAYQAAMSDMKKAGLNPILAYTQGGAASPSGSAASSGSGGSFQSNYGGTRRQDTLSKFLMALAGLVSPGHFSVGF